MDGSGGHGTRRRQGRPLKSFSRVAVGVGGAARKVGGSGFLPVASLPSFLPSFLPIDVIVVDVFPLIFHSLFFSLDSDTRSIALSKVLFESELPHFFAHSVDGPSDTRFS